MPSSVAKAISVLGLGLVVDAPDALSVLGGSVSLLLGSGVSCGFMNSSRTQKTPEITYFEDSPLLPLWVNIPCSMLYREDQLEHLYLELND